MTKVKDLHRKWMKEPGYKSAYDALDDEFQLAKTFIEAKLRRQGFHKTSWPAG